MQLFRALRARAKRRHQKKKKASHTPVGSVLMCRNVKCLRQVYSHTQQCSNSMMTNIDGQDIFSSKEVILKCLGYWLSWDVSAKKAIDEAIAKSRRAFFMHRSQVFEGNLNPLSGRSLFEVCVVPILLCGCENWQLTSTLVCQLESFQGEIGRRILKLTQYHSTFSSRVALKVLSGEFDGQRKTLSNEIMKQDWQITLEKGHERDSTRIATRIANEVSWLKLWDAMLDEGAHGTVRLQSLYK